MSESYIKVKGQWVYYYRAVDNYGAIVDFYLSQKSDDPAARALFDKTIGSSGLPSKVVIDKSEANAAALAMIGPFNNICVSTNFKCNLKYGD